MDARGLLSAVFVCAALAGCASMPPGSTTMAVGSKDDPCRGNETAICKVVVDVTGCLASEISPDHEKVYVASGATPNMQWTLTPGSRAAGWRFATQATTGNDGIVFKGAAGKKELVLRGNSDRVVTFTNGGARGEYDYGINIVKIGATPGSISEQCKQKDPWVVNL